MSAGTSRLLRGGLAAVAGLCVALVGACARQGAPPGGPEDRRPPVVVRTEPDTFAVVTDFRGPVKFHFDERISERTEGTPDEAVIVSPATGEVSVDLGRRSLTVKMEGGFRPGLVYRITLLPAVRDMFSNQLRDPFELVFSTGGEFQPSAVAGLVWDRITGESREAIEVRAVAETPDSARYVAQTDTGGIYALRYLPPGGYEIVAFEDRNRDGVVDAMENQGQRTFRLDGPADTVFLAIPMLMPDTSAARVIRAEVLDSVTVVVELDDYLDPAVALENVGVEILGDSGSTPGVDTLYHEHEYSAFVEMVRDSFFRLDSLEALARAAAADSARDADSGEGAPAAGDTAAAPDTVPGTDRPGARERDQARDRAARRQPPPALAGAGGREPRPRPDGSTAPARRVVLVLAEGLVPDERYILTVAGLENINGVRGGGGEATLLLEPPPDSVTAVPDSATAEDTLAAPPDTGGVALRPATFLRPWRDE